jgi:hypothetical protein
LGQKDFIIAEMANATVSNLVVIPCLSLILNGADRSFMQLFETLMPLASVGTMMVGVVSLAHPKSRRLL